VEPVVGFAIAYAWAPEPAVAVAYSSVENTRTVFPVLLTFVAKAAWLVRVFATDVLHVEAAGYVATSVFAAKALADRSQWLSLLPRVFVGAVVP
tara:strand:+ start:252 stop:533 length:282 start_codon:yes stop_codon:yes gene_type:complete